MSNKPKTSKEDSITFKFREHIQKQTALWIAILTIFTTIGGGIWYTSTLTTRANVYAIVKEKCVSKEEYAVMRGEVKANKNQLQRIETKLDKMNDKIDRIIWQRRKQ